MSRGSGRRGAPRGGSPRSGKKPSQPRKRTPAPAAPKPATPPEPLPVLRLGFVRGVAPSKWAERWRRAVREQPLELVPVGIDEVEAARREVDVLLERTGPGEKPPGSDGEAPARHALHLYEESVALVVTADHELAKQPEIGLEELSLITLLDHPDHHPGWPAAQPWQDPTWIPSDAETTLEMVATGLGGALMALPLARHLSGKRTHAVIPVVASDSPLPGTGIWATWQVERDGNDVQRLIGVLRGRTARSSR